MHLVNVLPKLKPLKIHSELGWQSPKIPCYGTSQNFILGFTPTPRSRLGRDWDLLQYYPAELTRTEKNPFHLNIVPIQQYFFLWDLQSRATLNKTSTCSHLTSFKARNVIYYHWMYRLKFKSRIFKQIFVNEKDSTRLCVIMALKEMIWEVSFRPNVKKYQ